MSDSGESIDTLRRIEGVLNTRPESQYYNQFRMSGNPVENLGNLGKRVRRLIPEEWGEDPQELAEAQQRAAEIQRQSPFGNVLQDPELGTFTGRNTWVENAAKSFGKNAAEMAAFVGLMLGDLDPDPEKYKSGMMMLLEGEVPPKALSDAHGIMSWYFFTYGEDAFDMQEYQIAQAWFDAVKANWDSSILQMVRQHITTNYGSWDAFGKMLYEDPFVLVGGRGCCGRTCAQGNWQRTAYTDC